MLLHLKKVDLVSRLPSVILVLSLPVMIRFNAFSAAPPSKTIPIIGLKPAYDDIDTEFLCFLFWRHFDGISRQFYPAESILARVVPPADKLGMLTVVNPWNLTCITHWYSRMFEMNTDSAYARSGWDGHTINDSRAQAD